MQHEKVRIYILARELDMESKDLLDLCRQHGIDVKNQLSSLDPDQRDQIVALVRKAPAAGASKSPGGALLPPPSRVPNLTPARPPQGRPVRRDAEPAAVAPPQPVVPSPEKITTPVPTAASAAPPAKTPEPPPVARTPEPPPVVTPPPAAARAAEQVAPPRPVEPPPVRPAEKAPEPVTAKTPEPAPAPRPTQAPPPAKTPEPTPVVPAAGTGGHRPPASGQPTGGGMSNMGGPRVRNLDQQREPPRPGGRGRTPPRPTTVRMTPPPPLKPSLKPPEKKEPPKQAGPVKLSEIPPELLGKDGPITIEAILNKQAGVKAPPSPAAPVEEGEDEEGAEARKKGAAGSKRAPGGVVGREARHKERNARQEQRKTKTDVEIKSGRVSVLEQDEERTRRHRERIKKRQKAGPQPRKGKVPIDLPITVRSLSEAIGVKNAAIIAKLMGQGLMYTINSTLDPEMAETIALENGCELDVKRRHNVENELIEAAKTPDKPEDLVPRAPIVTIMGHVDHGKTSLLDKIRVSNVAATEAGGITQVIRAWRVDHGGRPITFLDTPGHEAFTKMRARGANVTDIAVIVVAADDGVMPQTEEAISHAKAAGVSIVVAVNKVDLPNANIKRTEQQLYGLGLIPDTMGGEVPFVHTSAATGKGVDQLLDMLSVVAELKELKSNPNKPGAGTCLEAKLSDEEGVHATLLIREGTLRRGDVIICGAAYGRVRAMYDDLGRPLAEAGPSVPVRVTGLDEVPNADDPFLVVPDLSAAREIAENRKSRQQEAAHGGRRGPITLETLSEAKIAELKVILKAEARGSIEAIRKELEKLHHDEVRVRVLHAAIGGISVSDVTLALTSPEDTLILGFNVVPDDEARALAEERGVTIKQYNIIYQLTDDVRSALEGKLKPREEVIHLGRAMVRESFKISRVGTIAGCYVTQGVIERSARVRVIRSGAVVYPPADRTVGLESLKRFKEDVKEVREGFECGIKVAGYDDIKVDDVIEAYRIEQVQRTLSGKGEG